MREKNKCTSAKGGRSVTRYEEEAQIEKVAQNTMPKKHLYKKRDSIVEHPFGTIKQQFGYTYFLTRGLESVNTEVSLICLAYNLKRSINIIGVRELIEKIKGGNAFIFLNIRYFYRITTLFNKIDENKLYC